MHGYNTALWWAATIFAASAVICRLLLSPGAPAREPAVELAPDCSLEHRVPTTLTAGLKIEQLAPAGGTSTPTRAAVLAGSAADPSARSLKTDRADPAAPPR